LKHERRVTSNVAIYVMELCRTPGGCLGSNTGARNIHAEESININAVDLQISSISVSPFDVKWRVLPEPERVSPAKHSIGESGLILHCNCLQKWSLNHR